MKTLLHNAFNVNLYIDYLTAHIFVTCLNHIKLMQISPIWKQNHFQLIPTKLFMNAYFGNYYEHQKSGWNVGTSGTKQDLPRSHPSRRAVSQIIFFLAKWGGGDVATSCVAVTGSTWRRADWKVATYTPTGVNMQEFIFIWGGGGWSIHWTILHPHPPMNRNHSRIYARVHPITTTNTLDYVDQVTATI